MSPKGSKMEPKWFQYQSKATKSILLQNSDHERILYEILILRRVIQMNPGILDNISKFTPGLEIVFPSAELIGSDTHIIDYEIAKHVTEKRLFSKNLASRRNLTEMLLLSI